MRITLLDKNESIVFWWRQLFEKEMKEMKVNVAFEKFDTFMQFNINNVDAVVSPANSFGLMDGGYDKAIIEYFGNELMEKVQEKIISKCHGEQVIGTSISLEIPNFKGKYLIHSPTMRWPERILDPRVIIDCTRTAILEAKRLGVEHVVIPAFGGLTGKIEPEVIAKCMHCGYERAMDPNMTISWDFVNSIKMLENVASEVDIRIY